MDITKDFRKLANDLRFWPGKRLARPCPVQNENHSLKQPKNCSNSFHSEVKP